MTLQIHNDFLELLLNVRFLNPLIYHVYKLDSNYETAYVGLSYNAASLLLLRFKSALRIHHLIRTNQMIVNQHISDKILNIIRFLNFREIFKMKFAAGLVALAAADSSVKVRPR